MVWILNHDEFLGQSWFVLQGYEGWWLISNINKKIYATKKNLFHIATQWDNKSNYLQEKSGEDLWLERKYKYTFFIILFY